MSQGLPEVKTTYFPMAGGLDLLTPPISVSPGKCFDSLNYTPQISGGYRRKDGYERYDGRLATPTSANYWFIHITGTGISVGDRIKGQTSGATGRVLQIDGDAYTLGRVVGNFQANENIGVLTDRYWVGDTGDWTDTDHWSWYTGGETGASVPTVLNDVIFDASSFTAGSKTVSIPAGAVAKSLTCTLVSHTPSLVIADTLSVYGNITLGAAISISGFLDIGAPCTLTSATRSVPHILITNNSTLTLADNATATAVTVDAGAALHTNTKNLTSPTFKCGGMATIVATGSTITISTKLTLDNSIVQGALSYLTGGTWDVTGASIDPVYRTSFTSVAVSGATLDAADVSNINGAGNSGITFTAGYTVGVPFTFIGITYIPVTGADGKVWLDRNLGASQVATSASDVLAAGYTYQWGRLADGHQIPASGTTPVLSASDTPLNGGLFIKSTTDWRLPKNDAPWSGGLNNPCPPGWHIPGVSELTALTVAAGISDLSTAYASTLKLSQPNRRDNISGITNIVGGFYWTKDTSGSQAQGYNFAGFGAQERAIGAPIRCIQD